MSRGPTRLGHHVYWVARCGEERMERSEKTHLLCVPVGPGVLSEVFTFRLTLQNLSWQQNASFQTEYLRPHHSRYARFCINGSSCLGPKAII